MKEEEIYARLAENFDGKVGGFRGDVPSPFLMVQPSAITEVALFLRDDPDCAFEVLSNLTGVDYRVRLQVVYHLFSLTHRHRIVLKVDTSRENPSVPSVEGVWKGANWMEREAYDLLGIFFEGHSDLRRILLPEDWVGYPLRKDYVEQAEYDGISTTRESAVARSEP
jgi:NADH-quinone oxidoreductase subunit C